MKKFNGLGVAMVTPFLQNGDIDFTSLKKLTEHLINGGVNYLVVMGTTGENPTISSSEQAQILETVMATNDGKLPIVFGIGGNDTKNVIHRLQNTNLAGVDGILSVGPYYNKPSQEGVYQHFKAISEHSPLPVIMYNVPGRTGMTISAQTTLRIAELPQIVATKEASGSLDIALEIIRNKPADFSVISGDDNYTLPYIACGMSGVISVVGNAYPAEFSALINAALNNDFDTARMWQNKLLPMMNAIFYDGNPGGIKYVLNQMGILENAFRLPVVGVNEATQTALLSAMQFLK